MRECCGLMWNFDKIQPYAGRRWFGQGCGLMWNFDKIQPRVLSKNSSAVVV